MGKILKKTLGVSSNIGIILLLIMALLTFVDVILRYIFNSGFPDTIEISSMLLLGLISLTLSEAAYEKGHIIVELFVRKIPERANRVLEIINNFIGFVLFCIITWQSANKAIKSLEVGEFTGSRLIPLYPGRFIFAIGSFLLAVVFLFYFIKGFSKRKTDGPIENSR